jgi:hypothetical protein
MTKKMNFKLVLLSVATLLTLGQTSQAWEVVETGANQEYYVSNSGGTDDSGGYTHWAYSSSGSNGIYTLSNDVITAYVTWYGLVYWYNQPGADVTLQGWRKKQIDHECETDKKSYNWEVDIGVNLDATLNMDNGLAPIVYVLGDCKVSGEAYIILTGMGSALGNVKGTASAEEGASALTIDAGPVGLDLPIDLPGDSFEIKGDGGDPGQSLSSSGTEPEAVKGMHIRVFGKVRAYAECNDAAEQAQIETKTTLATFTLTPN